MSANELAPVIIKRKKVIAGGGHHGGAWKVAYADFVTAMMAFFLLMWLLNATTEVQRKGIEDSLARNGNGATLRNPSEKNMARGDSGTNDSEKEQAESEAALAGVQEMLTEKSGESMVSANMARHILTRVTDEGLIVEIFDLPGEPLFAPDSDEPTALMTDLAQMMAGVFVLVTNEVAVGGYTRSRPIVETDNPVWSLSSSRADRVRRLLHDGGLQEGRVQRVSGFADRKPVAQNPMAPRNNRIELILLRDIY